MLNAETKYQLLLQISKTISGTLDLDEILRHLLDAVGRVVEYDAAGIFVLAQEDPLSRYDRSRQVIAGMGARGFDPRPLETDPMRVSGEGIVGHVIRTGDAVVAPDVTRDPRYVEGRARTRAEIAVPITVGGRTIGALNLESDTPGSYAEDDLALLRFFAEAAAMSIERAMLHRHLLEKRRLDSQLQIAHEVQGRLLPGAAPSVEGYDIAGLSLSSHEIGGDYFDYLPLPGAALGLVIADVAGKGIPAALIMATFRALLRTHARSGQGVSHVVHRVNELLIESVGLPAFVTAVYGVLEPWSGRFAYANCGHNPPLLLRDDGRSEELRSSGPFLGAFETVSYGSAEVVLGAGDVLVLYTDGVVDASGEDGAEFGLERLLALVRAARRRPAAQIVRQAMDATRAFAGTPLAHDDFTLVVVARRAGPDPAATASG